MKRNLKRHQAKRRRKRKPTSLWLVFTVLLLVLLGAGTALAFNHYHSSKNATAVSSQEEQPTTSTQQPAQVGNTRVPVLYYHSIMVEPGNELRMPPEQFEAQMNFLAQKGYHVITLDQLYNTFYGKSLLPDKPIAITFDDGYRDNFTNAFPIMQKYHFPGTVFMVSSYINGDGFLTADQLKQLHASGWTIGGHTENHIDLSKVSSETVVKELKNSRSTLENLLGQPIKYIAYPFGGYNSSVMKLAKADGYTAGFTTARGWTHQESDPYALQRIYCYANMGIQEFERRITHPDY